jgi:hypothetical protein
LKPHLRIVPQAFYYFEKERETAVYRRGDSAAKGRIMKGMEI